MSDKDNCNKGNLAPAGHHDLAPIAATNSLVSPGLADLTKIHQDRIQEVIKCPEDVRASHSLRETLPMQPKAEPEEQDFPDVGPASRHPFDISLTSAYRTHLKLVKLGMRLKELHPLPKGAAKEHQTSDQERQTVLAMAVAELKLSVSATNCLDSEGITTVLDLVVRTPEELLEVRDFGETYLTEVREKLRLLGLKLRGD
jgi:hypothetical protein